MIILLKDRVNEKQVANLTNWLEHSGFQLHISKGAHQTIIGLIGDTSRVDMDLISSLDIVDRVQRILYPCKFHGCLRIKINDLHPGERSDQRLPVSEWI